MCAYILLEKSIMRINGKIKSKIKFSGSIIQQLKSVVETACSGAFLVSTVEFYCSYFAGDHC